MSKYINSNMFFRNLIDWRFSDNLEAFPCDELLDAILEYERHKETSIEIVHCKDCKYYETEGNYCNRDIVKSLLSTEPTDFCSWAERKEAQE